MIFIPIWMIAKNELDKEIIIYWLDVMYVYHACD